MGKKKKKPTSDPARGEGVPATEEQTKKKKKRRWHFGDRYEALST